MLHKLCNNKGSVLFVSVLLAVVLMFGGTALFLVAQVKLDSDSKTSDVFNVYTYQSMSKIMSKTVLQQLSELNATMYYTPLETDEVLFNKLQDALHKEFVDSAGRWRYNSLIPSTLSQIKINADVQITEFPSVNLVGSIMQNNTIKLPRLSIKINLGSAEYTCNLTDINICSDFRTNKIVCYFDTSNALVVNGKLTLR